MGVKQCALSMSTALAVSNDGLGFVWGGVNKWWQNTEFDPVGFDTDPVRYSLPPTAEMGYR